jgi:hypothetical protein
LSRIVVHSTIDLEHLEVHDEAANEVLAPELEPEAPAISEDLPSQLLGPSGSRAETPSGFDLGATRTMPWHTR